jgi:hypothetical protein
MRSAPLTIDVVRFQLPLPEPDRQVSLHPALQRYYLSLICDKESRVETLASVANLTIGWGRMPDLKVSAHHTIRCGFVGDTLDTQEFASDSTLP